MSMSGSAYTPAGGVEWYSRVGCDRLLRALRMDVPTAVRLMSRAWFPRGDAARWRREYGQWGDLFPVRFRTWFEEEFCPSLLAGGVSIADGTRTSYVVACELLLRRAAVVLMPHFYVPDVGRRFRVVFARWDTKQDVEKIVADAKTTVDGVCRLFELYRLYPPPRAGGAYAVLRNWGLRCGRTYLATMRPPSAHLLEELRLAYPHYFYYSP